MEGLILALIILGAMSKQRIYPIAPKSTLHGSPFLHLFPRRQSPPWKGGRPKAGGVLVDLLVGFDFIARHQTPLLRRLCRSIVVSGRNY